MRLTAIKMAVLVALMAGSAAGLDIVPTFVDTEEVAWTDAKKAVVLQAIADYEAVIDVDETVSVMFSFFDPDEAGVHAMWWGAGEPRRTRSTRPWTRGLRHGILISYHLANGAWFDPTPATDDDIPADKYDALTVYRHEIGHMMGHRDKYCWDGWGRPDPTDMWMAQIDEDGVFDAEGLAVPMCVGNYGHAADAGLMNPVVVPGRRYDVTRTVQMLATAYGYPIIEPSEPELTVTAPLRLAEAVPDRGQGGSGVLAILALAALTAGFLCVSVSMLRAMLVGPTH